VHIAPPRGAAPDAPARAGSGHDGQEPSGGTKIDASRGGITIASGVNSLTFGARAQFRWTLDNREEVDADTVGTGVGEDDGTVSQFDIPRLRLTLSGGVYKPWLRYSFQFEFSRTSGESASKIKDAAIEFRPVGRSYRVAGGQFKVPFGLQELTSSGRLQFVDRAITDSKFTPGRDMGVMVSGTAGTPKLGYEAGVFNGAGESNRQNNGSHLWAARLYYQPFGAYTLSESAIDAGDTAVLHLGLGLRGGKQIRGRTTPGIMEDADDQSAWNVEVAYRRPRMVATAEYFQMTDEQQNPTALPDIRSRGYHIQGGYMAVPRRVEVGVLWAWVNGSTDVDDAAVSELRAVGSYYWLAHNLKLQADAGQVGYGARYSSLSARARQGLPALGSRLVSGHALSDTQVRVQLQLAF
jgi:hypothetical protein